MVNTINPADCDRVTVYTGECRNFQDTEWITFVSGRRRSPDARDGNTWLIDVAHGSFWMRDDQVRDLVRLVPARPLDETEFLDLYVDVIAETSGLERVALWSHRVWAKKIVERLNANGGLPDDPAEQLMREVNNPDPEKVALDEARIKANIERNEAWRETDRWRRAHEIVEQERDQARASLHEACKVAQSYKVDAYQATERAEAAEGVNHDQARLIEATRAWADEWRARAEAAEARTAPAVTKADIEKAIRGKVWAANREPNKAGFHRVHIDWATDAVWSLVSGADPAVFVVREGDVAAVEVKRASDGWYADGAWLASADETAEWVRDRAAEMVVCAARNEAVAHAIEQDAAADPLLDKAQEFAALADWELTDREAELLHTVAAHVLGQEEVRHVDQ